MKKGIVFLILFSFLVNPHQSVHSSAIDPHNTYQWPGDEEPWYEWWYYKLLDEKSGNSFYFCYGIVNPWDTQKTISSSRAFVSFGDFKNHTILQTSLPVEDFFASSEIPFVQIGKNVATDQMIRGTFQDQGHDVSWDLSFHKIHGWDSMGWGLGFPNLFNIYWHTAQMDTKVNGSITLDGKRYIIENADGYQDRNWGHRFPEWWFWIVSNAFDQNPESSFAAGGGHAQFKKDVAPLPTALLFALRHEDQLYEFRSSDFGNFFDWDFKLGSWNVTASDGFKKLEVTAWVDPKDMMDLQFHTPDGKIFHDYETLCGNLHVKLFERKALLFPWEKVVDLTSIQKAGLELGMDHIYDNDHFYGKTP